MTAPNLEQPDDADIDASLTLDGFDASDRYPEYGHSALRAAYRSGWADVVAAIRDSGYTVIALPEPEKRHPAAIGTGWDSAMRVTIWDNNPGIITIPVGYEPSVDDEGVANLAPDDAADLGAALIAAAQYAKGDTQ